MLCALPIDESTVGGLETEIFESVNALPGALYPVVWVVMQLGNVIAVPLAAAVSAVLRRLVLGGLLIGAGGLAWILAKVVKKMVERGRPGELLEHVILHGAPLTGQGFVSGHAAVAAALATVASPYLGRRARLAVWLLAALASVARVYVGAHLPLDIVGGAALGIAAGAAFLVVASLATRTHGPSRGSRG